MLNRLRATFRWKADGLNLEQLRQPIPSSALTIGGLLRHLAVCEDDVFGWRISGERPEALTSAPEGVDPQEWQFTTDGVTDAAQLYAFYDEAVQRSQARWAPIVAENRLDEPAFLEFGDLRPHVRRHVCDLIEEYGRHTGHTDLLREAIDGRVGEDPDENWTWPGAPNPA